MRKETEKEKKKEDKKTKKGLTRRDFLFKTLAVSSGFILMSILGSTINELTSKAQATQNTGCCYSACYTDCHEACHSDCYGDCYSDCYSDCYGDCWDAWI